MSAQANIAVYDGAATPVLHTLVGESVAISPDGTIVAKWKESITTLPDYAQVRHTMTKRKLPSGIFRVTNRTEFPVMEAVAGQNSSGYTAAPKVAYVDTLETVGYFSERGVTLGRRTARQAHINILGAIATSVAAATTGPAPELIDQLLVVS